MSNRLVVAAALAGVLSGCVVTAGNPNPNPTPVGGDITFLWTFAGKSCAAAGVSQVHITLNGGAEVLQNGGYYPCSMGGTDGVTLRDFAAGTYTFTVDGLFTGSNAPAYTTTGSVNLTNGSMSVPLNLQAVSTMGTANIYWTFAGKACAQAGITSNAGVTKVRFQVDNEQVAEVDCRRQNSEGVQVQAAAGNHSITIWGDIYVGGQAEEWYEGYQTFTLQTGQTTTVDVDAYPVGAGATFKPNLANCSGGTYLVLTLKHKNETPIQFAPVSCANYAASGIFVGYLYAGDSVNGSGSMEAIWDVTMDVWTTNDPNLHTTTQSGTMQAIVVAGLQDQIFTVTVQ